MPREMSAYVQAALQSNYLRLAVFAELHFVSGVEYVWNGLGPISWNGQTWSGLGELGSISVISEGSDLTASGVTISLSGIPNALVQDSLDDVQQGLPCKIYLVFLDAQCNPVDSLMVYAARMDSVTLDEGIESSTITVSVENRLSDLQRSQYRRWTQQEQQLDYPGDTSFNWVASLQDYNGSWGTGNS